MAPEPQLQWKFEAIGTHFWIGVYQSLDAAVWQNLQATVAIVVEEFDAIWSRFRADSLVARMSQQAGEYNLSAEGRELLQLYRALYDATDGAVTPLVGDALSDLGYDAQYSLQPKSLIRPVLPWDDVMRLDGNKLTMLQPALLDFGAAGKGYLVDRIGRLLEKAGVSAYCVDGSGDLRVRDLEPGLQIGIEHPEDLQAVIGVVRINDAALCVSAPNRRRWGQANKLHHIINPQATAPTQGIRTVAVQAHDAAVADGLATALFMVPPKSLQTAFDFDYLVLYDDYSVAHSPGFPAQLFIKQEMPDA